MLPGGDGPPADQPTDGHGLDIDEASRTVLAGLRARAECRRRAELEALREGAVVLDAEGRLRAADGRARAILGLTDADIGVWTAHEPGWGCAGTDGAVRHASEQPAARALATGEPQQGVELCLRLRDDRLVWVTADAEPVRGPAGEVAGAVITWTDDTARNEGAAALARSEERFRLLAEQSGDVVARMDLENRYLYVSPACKRVYGWRPEQMVGRTVFDFIHPDDHARRHDAHRELLAGGELATNEFRLRLPDDGWLWVEDTLVLVHTPDGRPVGLQSTTRDISRRRELEQRLREAAEHDPLTGVFNRRRLDEELRRQIGRAARSGEPSMLAIIDLDDFKIVNDMEGHLAGDALLRRVSAALSGRLRRSDTLCRLGGDEFAAILVGADEQAGAAIARMLVTAVAEAGEGRTVSASVGLARIEADDDPESLLARADEAMYAAKAAGRGGVHVGAEPQ